MGINYLIIYINFSVYSKVVDISECIGGINFLILVFFILLRRVF